MSGGLHDGDVRQRRGVGCEAGAQDRHVRQAAGFEFGVNQAGEFRLAGALMGEGQEFRP